MIYGYARVSTATQGRDGNSLEDQVTALEKYGWTLTPPSDDLLEVILKYDLTDILINRNEFGGFQITGTGTHNGVPTFVGVAPRKSSSRKYVCPCCGMSIRATRVVNVACLDCDEQLLLVG